MEQRDKHSPRLFGRGARRAVATALLAARYGADAAFASRLVLVSTVLSLVTAPLLLLLL